MDNVVLDDSSSNKFHTKFNQSSLAISLCFNCLVSSSVVVWADALHSLPVSALILYFHPAVERSVFSRCSTTLSVRCFPSCMTSLFLTSAPVNSCKQTVGYKTTFQHHKGSHTSEVGLACQTKELSSVPVSTEACHPVTLEIR